MAWRTFGSAETAGFAALTNLVSDIVQLGCMGLMAMLTVRRRGLDRNIAN